MIGAWLCMRISHASTEGDAEIVGEVRKGSNHAGDNTDAWRSWGGVSGGLVGSLGTLLIDIRP